MRCATLYAFMNCADRGRLIRAVPARSSRRFPPAARKGPREMQFALRLLHGSQHFNSLIRFHAPCTFRRESPRSEITRTSNRASPSILFQNRPQTTLAFQARQFDSSRAGNHLPGCLDFAVLHRLFDLKCERAAATSQFPAKTQVKTISDPLGCHSCFLLTAEGKLDLAPK